VQSYDRLLDTLKTLLSPGGCAWDAEQDVRSMARYLIEEAHEFYDAVAEDSSTGIIEELGDVLYLVSFIALLAERDGTFTLDRVCDGATEKMRRRHPHVFEPGGPKLDDADAVIRHWEKVKRGEAEEPAALPLSRALEKIPVATPPLLRAVRAQEKAAHYHFDWPEAGGVLDKLDEETAELRRAVEDGVRDRIADELGDVLFSLANLARFLKMDPGLALLGTVNKFQERLRWMETRCSAEGVTLTDLKLPELEKLWQKAKLQKESDAS